jgi:prepilin-type N-terminal cleavage/methylation domain-containing protein
MSNRNGFTLIELVCALMILTVGILALATTTAYTAVQIRSADLKTSRALAVTQTVEQIRAMKFDSVAAVSSANFVTIQGFKVWRDVTSTNNNLKSVLLYSEGLGYKPRSGWNTVRDTFVLSLIRP